MADATQYGFSVIETTEALIKAQGIHEGKWLLSVEFTVSIGLMGIASDDARPGAMIVANSFQLTKAPDQGAPSKLIVDAAKVNPAKVKA
ncbi:hypothetical protein V1283_003310 [Bradyrhizobium sp. AZCC 2262]|uniref:hypothetical protein n=1 Tax=Bradyrhizobium sp. AZCC 2262 TaxID=3117022 RepID=UPI002FF09710